DVYGDDGRATTLDRVLDDALGGLDNLYAMAGMVYRAVCPGLGVLDTRGIPTNAFARPCPSRDACRPATAPRILALLRHVGGSWHPGVYCLCNYFLFDGGKRRMRPALNRYYRPLRGGVAPKPLQRARGRAM